MLTTTHLKDTILEGLKTQEIIRIPASQEEFFILAEEMPFKIEYHDNEIVTMGLTTAWHELLGTNLIILLGAIFPPDSVFRILGSSTGVQIPRFEGGYYLPDITLVKGKFKFIEGSNCILTNPHVVIEILSKSTAKYDRGEKLPEYKHLESLQQIIFINQDKIAIETYERTDRPNTWLNQNFSQADETLTIEGNPIRLEDIYRNIEFGD